MMNQKEAVFVAVCSVTGFTGEGICSPTREQRAQVNAILFEGFRSGKIQLDREFNDTELKSYVSGLQSNWLRKDKRLNGGINYTAKNPGSRQGSGDAQVKALKALLSTLEPGTSDYNEVKTALDERVAHIAKPKTPTIDFSALPADLAAKFKK